MCIRDRSVGAPFFAPIFWSPFVHSKLWFVLKIDSKIDPTWGMLKAIFQKKWKMKKCVRTAPACTDCIWAHPLERSGWPKNWRKTATYFRTPVFNKKATVFKKRAPKGLQKGDFISGVAPLGAPLEPQADFWFKKWAHSAPKVLPGTEKCFKNDTTVSYTHLTLPTKA